MLTQDQIRAIRAAVDRLFGRMKARLLGRRWDVQGIQIGPRPEQTLQGLYEAAAKDDGAEPRKNSAATLAAIVENYLDAIGERTKAQVVADVQAFIGEAQAKGDEPDVGVVLGGRLADTWASVTRDVHRVVDSEAQGARALGALEGIVRINALHNIDDPTVFFVVVRDQHLCSECRRLHLLPDGVTPRVWKLSEVGQGYHRRGENNPKIRGLHPHCRCQNATLLPGWGFSTAGAVEFKGAGHDEYERQRT